MVIIVISWDELFTLFDHVHGMVLFSIKLFLSIEERITTYVI